MLRAGLAGSLCVPSDQRHDLGSFCRFQTSRARNPQTWLLVLQPTLFWFDASTRVQFPKRKSNLIK